MVAFLSLVGSFCIGDWDFFFLGGEVVQGMFRVVFEVVWVVLVGIWVIFGVVSGLCSGFGGGCDGFYVRCLGGIEWMNKINVFARINILFFFQFFFLTQGPTL